MEIIKIKEKKQPGDFVLAGKMIGITPGNALQALNRSASKHHVAVVNALEKIITSRETLLSK
jgi:hypothetical protein